MVTRILFDPRRDLPGGTTQSNPVTIEATPTGIREDGQVVIYPTTISTPITTGADIFQLPANTASNGWRLTVRDTITSAVKQQRVVRVPDQASIAYQSLPDIDPASFTVTPGTARQWDATFWTLIQTIGTLPTDAAVTAKIAAAVTNLVGGASTALDTLGEIQTALGSDPNLAATLTTAIAGKSAALIPTNVKSAAYTAAVSDFVPVDATAAAVTVTLPGAPADRTRVGVKKLDTSSNPVTIVRGGSTDVFNKAGGSTSLSLSLTNQSVTVQYQASTGIWYAVDSDLPYSQVAAAQAVVNAATYATQDQSIINAIVLGG